MIRACVITVSDRASSGDREDTSGPLLVSLLGEICEGDGPVVVPDNIDAIRAALEGAVNDGAEVVITTGGTGIGPRDVTPEAVKPMLELEVPGLAEAIRAQAMVPTAALSRGVAGICRGVLVVTLAGSNGAVRDGVAVLVPLLEHAVAQLRGGDH